MIKWILVTTQQTHKLSQLKNNFRTFFSHTGLVDNYTCWIICHVIHFPTWTINHISWSSFHDWFVALNKKCLSLPLLKEFRDYLLEEILSTCSLLNEKQGNEANWEYFSFQFCDQSWGWTNTYALMPHH